MTHENANSNSINDSLRPVPPGSEATREDRCQHRFGNGTRCRMAVPNEESLFCRNHAQLPEHEHAPVNLSASLTAGLTDFKSAVTISEFLARLLRLQAEDRISPRRAAVMAYTANLILRTLPAIEHELHTEDEEPSRLDFTNWPHPSNERAPPSHPDMSWRSQVADAPDSKEPL